MNPAFAQMLARYRCHTAQDYINALKEIMQELALLGLWRAKFFEHAAFYGGTALRILHGLDRFSEDLDFSLVSPDSRFVLDRYNTAVRDELAGFGFTCRVEPVAKTHRSAIQSAFIKADTRLQFIHIGLPPALHRRIPRNQQLKVRFEIDTNPPGCFHTEVHTLLQPIPFTVRAYQLPDLFSGRLHAILCRTWGRRVKGRDWYDLVWYVGRKIGYRLSHLEARLVQTEAWDPAQRLTHKIVQQLLRQKIDTVGWQQAKSEVQPFLADPQSTALWSPRFFRALVDTLQWVE